MKPQLKKHQSTPTLNYKTWMFVMLFALLLLPEVGFAQVGSSNQVSNQFTQFIVAYWPTIRVICGLAGMLCLVMAIINIFMKGEQGGAMKLVYFFLGALLLFALPTIMSNLLGIQGL